MNKLGRKNRDFLVRVCVGMLLLHMSFGFVRGAGQGIGDVPYISSTGVQTGYPSFNALLEAKFPAGWLTEIFDGSTALMDELYVAFSFSAQEAALVGAAFNMDIEVDKAYLVKFLKMFDALGDGEDIYVLYDLYDPEFQNLVLSEVNGKRLWFTGTIDNAYAGGNNDEGFVFVKGKDAERVDIYLHDWRITSVQPKNLGDFQLNDIMRGTVFGMASPFAVGSYGEDDASPFTAAFHLKGDNLLTGGASSTYDASGVMGVLAEIIAQAAPCIAIRPIETVEGEGVENKTCRLLFDDCYPAVGGGLARTNGKLDLPVRENRAAPSVDLGNAHGRCEFDGGQYVFTTAVSNSMFYVSSMAVCYRMLSMMGIRDYGVGSSVATPENNSGSYYSVWIKNGTFSTHTAEDMRHVLDVVAHGWYNDYTDLRLPVKTRIDGGTFNDCNVYACDASAEQGVSPVNSDGQSLCRTEMPVGAPAEDGLGTVELTLPNHPYYGTASLTPVRQQDVYFVYPYLPGNCTDKRKSYIHNWVTIIPQMGYEGLLTMGGDLEVFDTESDNSPRTNAYLFYAQLNEWTKQYASVDFGFVKPTVANAISLGGDKEFCEVTNQNGYEIKYGLYTMLSFHSNQWYTICPPYDVHNIYVLETLPDEQLADKGLTRADKGTKKYLAAQGEADGVLAQGIVTSLCPDILSGKGSGVFMNLIDICKKTLGLNPYPLTHYNPALEGHGAADANYYLYEQILDMDGVEDDAVWTIESSLDDYSRKWKYAENISTSNEYTMQDGTTITSDIVMQKGKIYSLFLPAGADNYWEGKYLIFEGYGPQIMQGKNLFGKEFAVSDLVDIFYDDALLLQGNSTFANYSVEDGEGKVFLPSTESDKHDFIRQETGCVVKPWDVYMVMSTANTEQYATLSALSEDRNSMSVQAIAEELLADRRPHISDKSLIAYAADGIVMKAFEQQRIEVYAVDGTLVWKGILNEGDVRSLSVAAGMYIIRGERETVKIVANGN